MAAQLLVCVTITVIGVQLTATEFMAGGVTVTVADPDLLASCVEVAVTVALETVVSVETGVNTPVGLTAPALDGLTVQVTVELKLPLPFTVAEHALVCLRVIEAEGHETETEVMLVLACPVTETEPAAIRPAHNTQVKRMIRAILRLMVHPA